MFTPTDLLRQYVKEAFARETIPASDLHIHTWAHYRRELANLGPTFTPLSRHSLCRLTHHAALD